MIASEILTKQESAEGEFGSWQVERHPSLIEYSRAILLDIRRTSEENSFRDVVGILFGTYGKDLVRVLAHRPLARENPGAPLSPLAAQDQATLLELLKSPLTDPRLRGLHPVGWYHSQPAAIQLSADDLAIYNRYFPVRWQVALVLSVEPNRAARAGFFFREKAGPLRSESSYREFVLEEQEQAPAPPPVQPAQPPAVPMNGAASLRPASAPDSSSVRPIAIREPVRKPAVPPIAIRQIVIPPVVRPPDEPIPFRLTYPEPSVRPTEERETPEPSNGTPKAAPVSSPIVAEHKPAAAPEFASREEKAPAKGKPRWVWISLIALLVVGIGTWVTVRRLSAPAIQTTMLQNAGLSLRAEKDPDGLRVNWDRNAPAIKKAVRAVLAITDGARTEQINLGVNELQSGSVMYAPVSTDVNFQLSVYSTPKHSVSESVRIVTSRPSPLSDLLVVKPVPPKPVLVAPPPAGFAGNSANDPGLSRLPSSNLVAPPEIAAPPPEPPPAPAPPAPKAEEPKRAAVTPPVAPPVAPPVQKPPEPPKPQPQNVVPLPPVAAPPQPTQQSTAVNYVAPKPIRKVLPEVPANIRHLMLGSITIDVKIAVDANGQVTDAIPTTRTKGNKLSEYLGVRAAQAARLWKFEPAKMNGKNASGETVVQFKF